MIEVAARIIAVVIGSHQCRSKKRVMTRLHHRGTLKLLSKIIRSNITIMYTEELPALI